jgi:DNA primase
MYPRSFIDELRSRFSLAAEIGKRVHLTKRGTNYIGRCPFHKEKTPSFSVSDAKGVYYCFGCGAHGDIFSFIMNMDGLSYSETIRKLADMAHMELPRYSPAEKAKEEKQAALYKVLEEACCFFQKNLYAKNGAKALTYLKDRGITDAAIQEFRLGYSGGTGALKKALSAKGIPFELMMEAGLYTKYDDEGISRDYFRRRVMFPISDSRNRIIAFGGRIMEEGEPKYLNSPETDLFHKGKVLFSYPRALAAAKYSNTVILSEGYMDVIALNMHGYANSVAPLGTAFTAEQAQLLWKMAEEPTICFDGDSAGHKAAQKASKLILPLLKDGKSFNFLFLPDGMDPDELLKSKGKEYFDNLLANPMTLSDFLWRCLTEGKRFDTPERFASLEKESRQILSDIKDGNVRTFYSRFFNNKVWELNNRSRRTGSGKKGKLSPKEKLIIPKINAGETEARKVIAYMVYYPEIMSKWLEKITFSDTVPVLKKAAETVTSAVLENPNITSEELKNRLPSDVLHYLASEFEILDRTLKLPKEIDEQMYEHFAMMEIKNIEKEIKETAEELAPYLNEPPPQLWEKYQALIKRKQELIEELYG